MGKKFINDAGYQVRIELDNDKCWYCPLYSKWNGLKKRTTKKYLSTGENPTYNGVTVCDEWYSFKNFRDWILSVPIKETYIKELELDKDLKDNPNRIYSPETCLLVPRYVNDCILIRQNARGSMPIGVYEDNTRKNNKYQAHICVFNKNIHLGRHATPELAHRMWQQRKIEYFDEIITKYKYEPFYYIDVEIALTKIKNNLINEYNNNSETKKL